jgi:fused signal recognition particle receptor
MEISATAATLLRSRVVTRTWHAMFNTGEGDAQEPETAEAGRGLFSRLRDNLSRSRRAMAQQLAGVMFNPADEAVWERLEEALLLSDCGVPATVAVIERLEAEADAGRLTTADELSTRLQEIIAELMTPAADPRIDITAHPAVLLVSGVNGTGKTTSIG